MITLSVQKIINRSFIYLFCIFLFSFLPSLTFADVYTLERANRGIASLKIKTMVNRPHENEVNIVHQIDELLIATYSKYDKTIKIWNSVSFRLVAEYNIPGDDILEIFSINKILFAKSKSSFYRISLPNDEVKTLFDTGYGASNSVITSKYIMFVMREHRSQGTYVLYNYITDKIEFTKTISGMCGACYVEKLYYSNSKY